MPKAEGKDNLPGDSIIERRFPKFVPCMAQSWVVKFGFICWLSSVSFEVRSCQNNMAFGQSKKIWLLVSGIEEQKQQAGLQLTPILCRKAPVGSLS